MRDVLQFLKDNKALDLEKRKVVREAVKNKADFIATSRKLTLRCTCGVLDSGEVWATSGALIQAAREQWLSYHFGKDCSPSWNIEIS